jgi:hypothetical protein
MSWTVQLTDLDPGNVEEAAERAYADFKARYSDADEVFPAMDEQFDAAQIAARALLQGKVVGEGNINVSLSGHANPGHKPRQGWSNDMVTVSVTSAVRAEVPAGAGG